MEFVLDFAHEFGRDVLVEVVPETGDFDVGVDLAARLLLAVRLVVGDVHVDFVDLDVGGTDGHTVAGGLDGQRGGPLETVQREQVTHSVDVFGLAVERHRTDLHRVGDGFSVLETDVGHLHGHVVFLPFQVEQLALLLGAVERDWLADLVFHLGDHASVDGPGHLGGHGLFQHSQVSVLQGVVESLGLGAVLGLDGNVGRLESGGLDGGGGQLVVAVESGRHVAGNLVHDDVEVAQFGVVDVGPERPVGRDLVELILSHDDVPFDVQVRVFHSTVVEVFHRGVVESDKVAFGQFDRVLVDGQGTVELLGALDDDLLEGGDFLDHFSGETGGLADRRSLVLGSVLLFAGGLLAGPEGGLVVLTALPRTAGNAGVVVVVVVRASVGLLIVENLL